MKIDKHLVCVENKRNSKVITFSSNVHKSGTAYAMCIRKVLVVLGHLKHGTRYNVTIEVKK